MHVDRHRACQAWTSAGHDPSWRIGVSQLALGNGLAVATVRVGLGQEAVRLLPETRRTCTPPLPQRGGGTFNHTEQVTLLYQHIAEEAQAAKALWQRL